MQYIRARSVADVTQNLVDGGAGAHVLAGGTDLLVQMKSRRTAPERIIDIKHLPGVSEVRRSEGGFEIGAAVSGAELGEDAAFVAAWPGVAEAAQLIGSTQIQGRATLIGNLCNASPAADTVPALIAADAVAIVAGPAGERELPVAELATGPGKTSLAAGEFVRAFRLPARPALAADAYLRFIPRTEMDIAVASAGVSLVLGDGGTVASARVALGAVAPTAYLSDAAAALVVGTQLGDEVLDALAAACSASAAPIDDKRGTVAYRRDVVGVLAKRAARLAYGRAKEKA